MAFCQFLCSVKFLMRSLGRFLHGAVFSCGYSGVSVTAFFEKKLSHFLTFVVKVGVVTAEASQSEKLREWDGLFYVRGAVRKLNGIQNHSSGKNGVLE